MSEWHDEGYRRKVVESLSREQLAEVMSALPDEELVLASKASIGQLGVYRIRLRKQERLQGKLEAEQTLDVTVQEDPLALRVEFVGGHAKGRRILYSRALRPAEMRVREKGILGVVPVWLGLDTSLAKNDSNHRVTDLSFGALLDLLEKDLVAGKSAGGHSRKNVGFETDGAWTTEYVAPEGCPGLYARRARLTMDLRLGVPVDIEIHDGQGFLERYRYELLDRGLRLEPDYFTPKGAGL